MAHATGMCIKLAELWATAGSEPYEDVDAENKLGRGPAPIDWVG
jgi:hypothetical protein